MAELDRPERLAALAETGLAERPPSVALDRLTRIASAALDVPVALISLVTSSSQLFASQVGLPEPVASVGETPLSHSFCQHVVTTERELVVTDAPHDPRVADNLAIRDLSVRAYAGMPIKSATGEVLGSFCAIDMVPRVWTAKQLDMLRELAEIVSTEIQTLARANRSEQAQRRLEAVVDEAVRTSKQTTHDLRTPLQVISLGIATLQNHSVIAGLSDAQRVLGRLERNVAHVDAMLSVRPSDDAHARLDLTQLVKSTCSDLEQLAVEHGEVELFVAVSASDVRRCLENLVSNARRFAQSKIVVSTREVDGVAAIFVDDDGPGLPTPGAYVEAWQIGKMFHIGDKSRTGLGLSIIRELVERNSGRLFAGPSPLGGASFGFGFPLA